MWHTEIRIKNEQAEAAERKAKYTPNIGTSAKLKTEQDETERTNEGKKMKQQTRWSSTKRWKMKTKIAPCLWTQLPVCCFYDDCRWSNIEHAQHLPKKSANVCIYWKIYPLPFISDKCILFMLPFFSLAHTHSNIRLPFEWMLHKIWWIWSLFHLVLLFPSSLRTLLFCRTRISYIYTYELISLLVTIVIVVLIDVNAWIYRLEAL